MVSSHRGPPGLLAAMWHTCEFKRSTWPSVLRRYSRSEHAGAAHRTATPYSSLTVVVVGSGCSLAIVWTPPSRGAAS